MTCLDNAKILHFMVQIRNNNSKLTQKDLQTGSNGNVFASTNLGQGFIEVLVWWMPEVTN